MKIIQAICTFFSCCNAALHASNSIFSVLQKFIFCLDTLVLIVETIPIFSYGPRSPFPPEYGDWWSPFSHNTISFKLLQGCSLCGSLILPVGQRVNYTGYGQTILTSAFSVGATRSTSGTSLYSWNFSSTTADIASLLCMHRQWSINYLRAPVRGQAAASVLVLFFGATFYYVS